MDVWIWREEAEWDRQPLPSFPPLVRCSQGVMLTPSAIWSWRGEIRKGTRQSAGNESLIQRLDREIGSGRVGRIHIVAGLGNREGLPGGRMRPQSPPVTMYVDRLQKGAVDKWKGADCIAVPSFYFKERIRRQTGISAQKLKVVDPAPPPLPCRWLSEGGTLRRRLRAEWGVSEDQPVLYVDPVFLKRGHLPLVRQTVRALDRFAPVLLVHRSKKLLLSSGPGEEFREWGKDMDADPRFLRLAADWILTTSGADRALNPIHGEALASGLPVITTDTGDHGEWVRHGHTGLLLDPHSWQRELVDYLKNLFRHPHLTRDLGMNARALAESHLLAKNSGKEKP